MIVPIKLKEKIWKENRNSFVMLQSKLSNRSPHYWKLKWVFLM